MSDQPLKVTPSFKFLGVTTDNYLSLKLHVNKIDRACLVNRMNIARLD